jgi:hypothetical protein
MPDRLLCVDLMPCCPPLVDASAFQEHLVLLGRGSLLAHAAILPRSGICHRSSVSTTPATL